MYSLVKCLIFSLFFSDGVCVAKWYMHTLCKRFMFDYGGEVVFDESLLPRHQDTCFITIVGNGTEQNRISFYFSSFNVGKECHAEINLIDGIADLYTRKVPGLEESLCRYQNLDERSIFETRERYLGIHVYRRWRTSSTNISFTIKFVSFTNNGGLCDVDDSSRMHKCSNGRCVSSDVVCRELNPCGDFSNACDDSFEKPTVTLILSTSKYVFIAVGAVVGLLCFAQGCFIVRRCCCKNKEDSTDPELELNEKSKVSQDPNAIETSEGTPTAIEERHFENLNLLRESRETDSDCEIKYSTTDYEKDSSFEDINYKSNARNNVIDTETITTVKRVYV